jgi:peptide/nickel transport system permease protein
MARFVVRRLVGMVPLMLIVSIGVFLLVAIVPGDAARAIAGPEATADDIVRIRHQYHLDKPLVVQYGYWLVLAAAFWALIIGIPLGIVAGIRPGRALDNIARLASGMGLAVPGFVMAIILVILFGVQRHWFPILGFVRFHESPGGWLHHVVLPAVTLGGIMAAVMIRQLRAAMLDVLDSNYVRAAWARGGSVQRVILQHGLKNAAMPAVTVFGLQLAALLGGAVLVEQIFSIPGLGPYMLTAITGRDVPVVQAVTLVFVICQMTVSLLVDISYGFLNPKVRVS